MTAPAEYRAATMPGDPARANEDLVGVVGGCAVLLDGSGAPGDLPTGCRHGVPWFTAQLGARCLAGMATAEPGLRLAETLAGAITAVTGLHDKTCDLTCPGTPSSMIVMARTTPQALEYLVLGDSAIVIEHASGDVQAVTDQRMDDVAVDEYRAMLALPTGTPEHQAARITFVKRQQPYRNQPGGYPVASTVPEAAYQALTGTIPAGGVRQAALVSDGATRYITFGLGTWRDLLAILRAGGPQDLFQRVRQAENVDPRGQRWPRAKQHDDISAIYAACRTGASG